MTSQGVDVDMPYTFIEDGLAQPAVPHWTCPTVVILGRDDDVVPEAFIQVLHMSGDDRAAAHLSSITTAPAQQRFRKEGLFQCCLVPDMPLASGRETGSQ